MEIIVGKTSGFCFGVKNAVDKTEEQLDNEKEMYCLGELVHNKQVIERLENKGAKFINDIKDAKNKVIVRAHGAEKEIYEFAKNNNIEIIDLTCPKVIYTHKIAEEYANKNYYIFLVGKKEHPEIIATKSFCGTDYTVIETQSDVDEAINSFIESKKDKALILVQTTYSLERFKNIEEEIKRKVPKIEVKNTICNATKDRQEETEKLAKTVNAMIIIGGKHSSNTTKLYELAKKYCNNVQIVETENELNIEILEGTDKIGIMAGASTPKESIEQLVRTIERKEGMKI